MYIGTDAPNAQLQVYQQQTEKLAKARQEKGESVQSDAARGDSVTVSDSARLMAEASRVARETPDVRQEKVAMLKEQVQNGTYEIDNERIAAGLLREDSGLFRA